MNKGETRTVQAATKEIKYVILLALLKEVQMKGMLYYKKKIYHQQL